MKRLQVFKNWFHAINFEKEKLSYMDFVWELKNSPYIEYHYFLLKEDLSTDFKRTLYESFQSHGEEGELLLLSKLNDNEDREFQGEIIFLLGIINGKHRKETLYHATKLAHSQNPDIRYKAYMVIGWLGSIFDINLLGERLEHDTIEKCRAQAATSILQIWFKDKSTIFRKDALPILLKALEKETSAFVLVCIIDAVQQMVHKNLGLQNTMTDGLDESEIEEARKDTIKHLKRYLKKQN